MNTKALPRVLLVLAASVPGTFFPATLAAQEWPDFEEISGTHIVADEGAADPVGLTDTFEKDLAAGDVDRDGDIDLLIARKVRFSNPGGKRNVVFLNEGGVLVDRTAEVAPDFLDATDDRDILLVDVDGDTWLDVVTATTFAEQPRLYLNLGDPDADGWDGFALAPGRLPAFDPGPQFCAVAAGDVDNDTDQDLFFVDYNNALEDRLLINDGKGFFSDETDSRLTPEMSISKFGTDAQIVDMNMDGALDIVKIDTGHLDPTVDPNVVVILYNAGGEDVGTFDTLEAIYSEDPYMMEIADLNNDGRPDVYVADDAQDVYLLHTGNNVDGFATFQTLAVGTSPLTDSFGGNVVLADLDLDGYRDAAVADVDTDIATCGGTPVLLQNQADVPTISLIDPLTGTPPPFMPNGAFDLAVADFSGDGAPDLWLGTCTGNRLYLSNYEAVEGAIFSDGFESGNTSAWSS